MLDRPKAPSFDATMVKMYRRKGVDTLPAHLEELLGITVTRVQPLDVGVFRINRLNGTPLVARLFSARRPHQAVVGDLAVLAQLQTTGFPAERPLDPDRLWTHDDQAVLVTHFVRAAPKSQAREGNPITALGALVGRLHRLEPPTGAADRPAGALHHYAEGTPADELSAARRWLRDIESRVPVADHDQLDILGRMLAEADDSTGLAEAFIHPDPVPRNTVFTTDGPVLVDWAGAGRGPRLASLALVLRSRWAGPPFMRGYATSIQLDAEERQRAADVLMTRALIDVAFRVCREPIKIRQQVKALRSVRKRTGDQATALLGTT